MDKSLELKIPISFSEVKGRDLVIKKEVRVYGVSPDTVGVQLRTRGALTYGGKFRNIVAHAEFNEAELTELITVLTAARDRHRGTRG